MMSAAEKYNRDLANAVQPGEGCHDWLLTPCNHAAAAGVTPEQCYADLTAALPTADPRHIADAIKKAYGDHKAGGFVPTPKPPPAARDGKQTLRKITNDGTIDNEADLWERSPVRLLDEPKADVILLLETLYRPDDLLFIGDRIQPGIINDTIRPVANWINYFRHGGATSPHIILNPLSGRPAPTKGGDKETLRGDGNIQSFQYCIVEFDNLSREEQLRFWSAIKLPIVALIDSGGKSIHGWLDVSRLAEVHSLDDWQTHIKARLYDKILSPLGVDASCSNCARLSRLPGHYRKEKEAWQRLLWLSPEGRPVCS